MYVVDIVDISETVWGHDGRSRRAIIGRPAGTAAVHAYVIAMKSDRATYECMMAGESCRLGRPGGPLTDGNAAGLV